MRKSITFKTIAIFMAAAAMTIAGSICAFAGPGDGRGGGGIPNYVSVPYESHPGNLDAIVAGAGLGSLGVCAIQDPILDMTPMLYYRFESGSNDPIINGVPSTSTEYCYAPDGFQRLYCDHAGMGRYYYRVYSDAHGWSAWCNSKEHTPINDDGTRVQAVQIRMKGYCDTLGDLYYKVVMSDGTVLDWAKNGQITGTMGTDRYIVALAVSIQPQGSQVPSGRNLMEGKGYEGVYIAQDGNTYYGTYDGRAYTGWGWLGDKQYYFIDGNAASGWQYIDGYKYYLDADGSIVKDLEPIMGLPGSYNIKYNKATRTMYIMANDPDGGGFIIPYKTFMTSCGPDTPIGTFKTYARYDWKFMHGDEDGSGAVYCQKLTRFKGNFLMHSLLYYKSPNPFTLDAINYNFIDDAVSGGCIRLRACDANWIYKNVPLGTPVITYNEQYNKGPVEKDAITQAIPRDQNYDPTDEEALAVISAQNDAAAQAAMAAEAQASIDQAAADDAAAQ